MKPIEALSGRPRYGISHLLLRTCMTGACKTSKTRSTTTSEGAIPTPTWTHRFTCLIFSADKNAPICAYFSSRSPARCRLTSVRLRQQTRFPCQVSLVCHSAPQRRDQVHIRPSQTFGPNSCQTPGASSLFLVSQLFATTCVASHLRAQLN